MSRFYVPKEKVKGNQIHIDGDEAHHILDVMRMEEGDKVVVFDGTGAEYTGYIKNADKGHKKAVIEIIKTGRPLAESLPDITLAQAIPKKGKMDSIVEKATELGISSIIPLISDRTIVRPDESGSEKKVERWRKIALEASKQCGRTNVPVVKEITRFKDVAADIEEYDLALIACLTDKTVSIKETLKGFNTGKILVFIGPEGDFTPDEIDMAHRGNCISISLGTRVLKSDTAGIFVLAAMGYEFSL